MQLGVTQGRCHSTTHLRQDDANVVGHIRVLRATQSAAGIAHRQHHRLLGVRLQPRGHGRRRRQACRTPPVRPAAGGAALDLPAAPDLGRAAQRTVCSKRALASRRPRTACPASTPYLSLTVLTMMSLRNLRTAHARGRRQRAPCACIASGHEKEPGKPHARHIFRQARFVACTSSPAIELIVVDAPQHRLLILLSCCARALAACCRRSGCVCFSCRLRGICCLFPPTLLGRLYRWGHLEEQG